MLMCCCMVHFITHSLTLRSNQVFVSSIAMLLSGCDVFITIQCSTASPALSHASKRIQSIVTMAAKV